jgi:hypothetical protein
MKSESNSSSHGCSACRVEALPPTAGGGTNTAPAWNLRPVSPGGTKPRVDGGSLRFAWRARLGMPKERYQTVK